MDLTITFDHAGRGQSTIARTPPNIRTNQDPASTPQTRTPTSPMPTVHLTWMERVGNGEGAVRVAYRPDQPIPYPPRPGGGRYIYSPGLTRASDRCITVDKDGTSNHRHTVRTTETLLPVPTEHRTRMLHLAGCKHQRRVQSIDRPHK